MNIRPILLCFLLAGCGLTPGGDAARQVVAVKGAEIMDEGVANCRWFFSNGMSIGAYKRWIATPEDSAAYQKLFAKKPQLPE